jgi:hypothetical protein
LPLPDFILRDSSTREPSLKYIILDSPPAETRDLSGIKTTVITVENFSSAIEGQSAVFTRTRGIMSADELVNLYHFKDAIMVTSFYD